MKNYIISENLKHRHSFLRKLLLISPLVAVLQAFILMPAYFTINAYNWWYVVLLPATFALVAGLIHLRENRKLKYRAIYSLDLDLEKIWISKLLIALIYMAIAIMIHMLGVYVLQFLILEQFTENYGLFNLFLASLFLLIANIWQIPLCLFLAKKFGFIISVVVNTGLGMIVGVFFADSSFWIFCPYSWASRLMLVIMKILPNGIPVEATNPMLRDTAIFSPIILSLALFFILTVATAKWFSRLEVK